MKEWLKIAENLAHKRAGVVLGAMGAIVFGAQTLSTNIIVGALAAFYTLCQTVSDTENGVNN